MEGNWKKNGRNYLKLEKDIELKDGEICFLAENVGFSINLEETEKIKLTEINKKMSNGKTQ